MLDLRSDVYVPVVDVENIDFVVRDRRGEYKAVQIKTRSPKKRGEIFEVNSPKPSRNYFVVLHIAGTEEFWVLPFRVFSRHRVRSDYFTKRGRVRLVLSQKKKKALHRFKDKFDLLT